MFDISYAINTVLVTVLEVRVRYFGKHQKTFHFLKISPKMLTDVIMVNLIFFPFWHSAVSKFCAILSKLIDCTHRVNSFASAH